MSHFRMKSVRVFYFCFIWKTREPEEKISEKIQREAIQKLKQKKFCEKSLHFNLNKYQRWQPRVIQKLCIMYE